MLPVHLLVSVILGVGPGVTQTTALEQRQLDEAKVAYQLGQEQMQRESFEEAAVNFRKAIALDPKYWLAHYGLGQSQMALKRYPEAVKAYQSCRDVFVSYATLDASEQHSLEKSREDEIRDVQDTLLAVQQGKVKSGSPASLEVQLQERLRVLEGARLRGKENVVSVPAGLMLGLGSAHFKSGQKSEAQAAFLEAVQLDPKLGPAHNNLAVIYMMDGHFDEAKQEVKRAEKSGVVVSDTFKQELERRAKGDAKSQ